jgi:hypothetical protein
LHQVLLCDGIESLQPQQLLVLLLLLSVFSHINCSLLNASKNAPCATPDPKAQLKLCYAAQG